MNRNAAQAYLTQHVMTASSAQLVAMLYDRAIRALRDAIRAVEAHDPEQRFNNNRRAVDIISHLWGTLDMDRGGEVATNLADLYRFMLDRLRDVDMRNDAQAARDVIDLLGPLAESWRNLAAGSERRAAAPAASGAPAGGGPALRGQLAVSA